MGSRYRCEEDGEHRHEPEREREIEGQGVGDAVEDSKDE